MYMHAQCLQAQKRKVLRTANLSPPRHSHNRQSTILLYHRTEGDHDLISPHPRVRPEETTPPSMQRGYVRWQREPVHAGK